MGFGEKNIIPVGKICNATSDWSVIRSIMIILSRKCCSQTASFADIWDVKQSSIGIVRNEPIHLRRTD